MAEAKKEAPAKVDGKPVVFKGKTFSPFKKVALKFKKDYGYFKKDSVHTVHELFKEKYVTELGVAVKVALPKKKTLEQINKSDLPQKK